MTPPSPATLAAYRANYPGYMLVFRAADSDRCWVSCGLRMTLMSDDETADGIFAAVMGGVGVLVVEDVKESAPR